MRILVIGGTGFIGRWIVHELTKGEHEVTVFHRGQTIADLPSSVAHINGDRRKLRKFAAVFRDWAPEVVLDTCAYDRDAALELDRAIKGIACQVALISSMDVYRAYGIYSRLETDQPIAPPFSEDAPLRSVLFPYRASAKSAEDLAHRYDKIPVEQFVMHEMNRPATILRLAKVYGPGDPQRHLEGYSREICRGMVRLNQKRAQWRWSRAYVENVAAAIAKAVSSKREDVRVYNIADEPVLNEQEWMGEIASANGCDVVFELSDEELGREDGVYNWNQSLVADTSRVRDKLGWSEKVGLSEALRRSLRREKKLKKVEG